MAWAIQGHVAKKDPRIVGKTVNGIEEVSDCSCQVSLTKTIETCEINRRERKRKKEKKNSTLNH